MCLCRRKQPTISKKKGFAHSGQSLFHFGKIDSISQGLAHRDAILSKQFRFDFNLIRSRNFIYDGHHHDFAHTALRVVYGRLLILLRNSLKI
jgi:hypothetical protein